ncbi:hypothetical protein QBC37DRAFT_457879 [Rhypophila decipiens]|uniref:Uncharacterized protein n=1 Tax=Rhypophila decipiens TaxID=261697 RepID=A0AAN6YFN3_9PEZI|nr:hypothetical protein QBC37DRAFT_457879 [Rhypophila decipiens]
MPAQYTMSIQIGPEALIFDTRDWTPELRVKRGSVGQIFWQIFTPFSFPPTLVQFFTGRNLLTSSTSSGVDPSHRVYLHNHHIKLLTMSFGWSAGDIAAAIKLAHRVYDALDSCHGAKKEYREETSFLKELIQTLEPLKSFTAWGAHPVYGKDIIDRVAFMKEPVENMLQEIVKLEASLGAGSKSGRHRNVLPKLEWHFRISKRVLDLRTQIGGHMRILDSLLQRLTLDIVSTVQLTLPDVFVSAFQRRIIRPDLIRTLKEIVDTSNTTKLLFEHDT